METPWRKADPEAAERFRRLASTVDGAELRTMFGYPASFVNGNLAFGMFQDSFMVRLPQDVREECLAGGWTQFSPMPGRPMREYLEMPAAVAGDDGEARAWMQRAAEFVAGMPPKQAKPRKRP
jgi:TfoX/Sxy family transcriptional regulator of competence genes